MSRLAEVLRDSKIRDSKTRLALIAALLVVVTAAPAFLGLFWTSIVIQILIFGLFALSHDLLIGHTGLLPLGHAAFFSVAAYTTAILQVSYDQPVAVAAVAGLGAGFLLAVIFGFSIRTPGVYFILLTLALGMIIWGIAHRWSSFTGGDNGIVGVDPPVVFGIDFSVLDNYYYFVLVSVAICVFIYWLVVNSPFGLTLRGIRESEERMRSLGYRVQMHKFVAFVMSGSLAGVAGVLYVYWNKFMSPAAATLARSAEAVLMVIVGGTGTLSGPFVGAAVITWIRNQLSADVDRFMTVMGLIFILTAMYATHGLIGVVRRAWKRGLSRREVVTPTPDRDLAEEAQN